MLQKITTVGGTIVKMPGIARDTDSESELVGKLCLPIGLLSLSRTSELLESL